MCIRDRIIELGGVRSKLEYVLFWWKRKGKLIGIMCTHVDDFCFGGSERFLNTVIRRMKEKLEIGSEESQSFKYIGVKIHDEKSGVWLEQERYMEGIKIPDNREYYGNRDMEENELTVYRLSLIHISEPTRLLSISYAVFC